MSNELFTALASLEKEKGIPIDFTLKKIEKSIITACKSSYGNEDASLLVNPEKGEFEVFLKKLVVEEVNDTGKQILLQEALSIDPNITLGEILSIKLDTKKFGRIAAQTARNIIRQGIRDGEREQSLKEFQARRHEIVSAIIENIEFSTGAVTVKIGKAEATLVKNEQIGTEKFREGSYVKVYIVDVLETDKGPKAIISRTHPDFIKKLFETEVPEIHDGTIEIKAIAREAGKRTKMAVKSNNPQVDPIGSCIGPRGARVNTVIEELGGEKIDIIEFNEDEIKFITSSIAPAEVLRVELDSSTPRVCHVTVPNDNLSLAIGNKGQNARLAAKLTGWKIDIRPETPQ
ncbi:MAG: transcription termination factor NusA [Oscillospiraceae bacterium]|jgi:N utilization substance protein A|nr:transcription termination factor NusA [Oscillospiraceae bacterium]